MTCDEYLVAMPEEARRRLKVMRSIVRKHVPDAIESFSYGMIGYKLLGKPLIYFGGFANHIGLYATPNGHQAFQKEFSLYRQGKGSVQFPLNQPLPTELIIKVVNYRKKQLTKKG